MFMRGGNTMKQLYLYILLFTFTAFSYATDNALIFETKNFLIKISPNCEEGNVACDKISYAGIRKSDGAKINLYGKSLNRNCEKSTCDFYGYEFKNGKYTYTIYGRNPASLTVRNNDKIILSEEGTFSSDTNKFDTFVIPKKIQNNTFLGSSLLSKKDIISLINESCDFPTYESSQEKMDSCIVSKMDEKYIPLLESLEKEHQIYLGNKGGFKFYLKASNDQNNIVLTLSLENNKSINDLDVYTRRYWESGVNTQYYYIDDNFENIWVLKIIEDEISRRVNYFKKFHIDNAGQFKLDTTISCKYKLFYPERKKTIATCSNS